MKKPYIIIRPFCSPHQILTMQVSEKEAIKHSNKTYGYCAKTIARLYENGDFILC